MNLPQKINIDNLRPVVKEAQDHGTKVVARSALIKCGGLYRIRDGYEQVWNLEKDADGRSYITRLGDENTEAERRYIAEDSSETTRTEARSVTAFKTLRDGTVHHVWECRECDTPNITKEGNAFECDNCHREYADAKAADKDTGGYDQKEAGELYGDWLPARMKKEGVTKIAFSLIKVWAQESDAL